MRQNYNSKTNRIFAELHKHMGLRRKEELEYKARLKAELDYNQSLSDARQEGLKRGKSEGKQIHSKKASGSNGHYLLTDAFYMRKEEPPHSPFRFMRRLFKLEFFS